MKTKEELNALKAEFEALNKRLAELSEDEMKQVTGGGTGISKKQCPFCGEQKDIYHIKNDGFSLEYWQCMNCGPLTYNRTVGVWVHGINQKAGL